MRVTLRHLAQQAVDAANRAAGKDWYSIDCVILKHRFTNSGSDYWYSQLLYSCKGKTPNDALRRLVARLQEIPEGKL